MLMPLLMIEYLIFNVIILTCDMMMMMIMMTWRRWRVSPCRNALAATPLPRSRQRHLSCALNLQRVPNGSNSRNARQQRDSAARRITNGNAQPRSNWPAPCGCTILALQRKPGALHPAMVDALTLNDCTIKRA